MVERKIGKHTVQYYDSIDELPIVRFHKYQKFLLVDSGIGGDINSFDARLERTRLYLTQGKMDEADKELRNMRQSIYLIQQGINPKHRAFATLVTRIDDERFDTITDDVVERICAKLSDVRLIDLAVSLEAAKKKIDAELMLYFPRLFNDSDIKEYFDILRRRTVEILNNIVKGKRRPDKTEVVENLNARLITYSNPKEFTGSEGVEVQFDRQFENLCLVLSEQLHVKPKEYTVMEFYNAFDFIQDRAKQNKK